MKGEFNSIYYTHSDNSKQNFLIKLLYKLKILKHEF